MPLPDRCFSDQADDPVTATDLTGISRVKATRYICATLRRLTIGADLMDFEQASRAVAEFSREQLEAMALAATLAHVETCRAAGCDHREESHRTSEAIKVHIESMAADELERLLAPTIWLSIAMRGER